MAMNMAMHQNAGPGGPMSQSRHSGGGPPNNQGGFFPAGVPRVPSAADLRAPLPVGRHIFHPFNRPYPKPGQDRHDYDAKQARKSSMRKTVDYYASAARLLENRLWQRDFRDRHALQPDVSYYPQLVPPSCYLDNPSNAITTRFTKVATNKIRCPVFCLTWTPEGRRLITGASSGEFTLWNGLTFNFETILQAHDSPVRSMVWSHNDIWMVTGDNGGYVKYWQSNMNNVKMFQAHKEAIRGISFAPTDQKLATCSDDGTVRIWDFVRCHEERILRGHGADVKCVDWHPYKGLIVSGSKDNQQPVKLWDPKSGQSLATLHHHKSTVMDARWNQNGHWLLTASRDHLIKLYDIRRLDQELQNFRGHKREASCLSWHPFHQDLFASGGSDGAIMFWNVGVDKEVGAIEQAHESLIWSLAWHPIGHILCSGSNDHTSKFWTRNRPGDKMRDKYNLNTLPPGIMPEEAELIDEPVSAIPGMGPDDKVDLDSIGLETEALSAGQIPGLDMDPSSQDQKPSKKVPYAKPIPRTFQVQWNEPKKGTALPNSSEDPTDDEDGKILGVDSVEQPGKAKVSQNTAGLSARHDEDRELYGDEDGEGNVAEHRNAEPGKHEGSAKATQQPSGLLGDFPRDFPSRGPNQAPMPPQGRDNAPRPPFYPPGPPRGPGPGWNRPPFMGGPPHPMGMQPFPPRFPGQPDMRPRFYHGMQQQQRFGPPRGNWPGPEDHGEDEYGEYGSGGNAGDSYSDNSKPYGDNFWPEWNGDHDSRPPRGNEEEEWMPRDEEQYQGYGNQQQQHHHYPQERWNNDGDMRSGRGYRRHGRGQRRGGGGGGYKNY